MRYTIFYSWQSDTESKYNRFLIQRCINSAIKNIEDKGQLKGVFFNDLEESTSNIPGTPDVVSTIEERIDLCDIFIGDLTIANSHHWILSELEKNPTYTYKFSPNTNVYGEYNRAIGKHGSTAIIAVMNTFYGDPKENSEILPFDIRQKRFPLRYSCGSDEEIEESSFTLIRFLEDAIRSSILKIIDDDRYKYLPFITYIEHKKEFAQRCQYFTNSLLDLYLISILQDNTNVRLLGISGIGKTRLVIEAVGRTSENTGRYLYCDCFVDSFEDVRNKMILILQNKENPIIVLDNCNSDQARIANRTRKRYPSANCKIITIWNQEETTDLEDFVYINLNVDLHDVVDEIINNKSINVSDENKMLIREFSAGIPLMALLLVESINKGAADVGKLTNKDFVNKLIFEDKDEREIAKSCSLFRYIGFNNEYRSQIKFIVENSAITPINGDTIVKMAKFDKLFNKYKKREIVEIKGRLFGIRPRPLAFALAEEWFEDCEVDRMEIVIKSIQDKSNPDSKILTESLCSQIVYLGNNEKVKSLIGRLTDINGPFDNAEVVNTELGSRLFRSFVEVNPEAVANNLYRLFGKMSLEQLRNVQEGRRNLVWTLGKLCFYKNTFELGSKLMMIFGAAENESWANNATNEFLHLFNIRLAGTQANLNERLGIIKWGLSKGHEFTILSIKALGSALETQHFSRVLGAETQGTKKLEDYIPSSTEIINYWTDVLNILEEYVQTESNYSSYCVEIIEIKARGFFKNGMATLILPIIRSVAESFNFNWERMLDILKSIKLNEFRSLNQEIVNEIDNLIKQLTKTDFYSRFASVQKNIDSAGLKINFKNLIEIQQEEYSSLANEFVINHFCSNEILYSIFSNKNILSFPFGLRIAELIEGDTTNYSSFIEKSLDILLAIDPKERNNSIIIDFARGIKSDESKNILIDSILSREELAYLLFPVFGIFKKEGSQLDVLFSLVDNEISAIDEFKQYFKYMALPDLSVENFVLLCHKIEKYGVQGKDTVLSLLHRLLYFGDDKNPVLYNLLEELLFSISLTNLKGFNKDDYFQMVNALLNQKESVDFAKYINLQVIQIAKNPRSSLSFDYYINNLYSVLIEKYFEEIWPDLSIALLSEGDDYFVYYQFKNLIGSQIGGVSNEVGILFRGKIELIFDWCREFPEKAPERLASMVPIFDGNEFHPITLRLINDFGDNQDVLSNLGSNMESYSWVGSIIPLLESKRMLLRSLLSHSNPMVVEWAKRSINYLDREIENERNIDDEHRFLYS